MFERLPRADWAFFEFGDEFPKATCIDPTSEILANRFVCQPNVYDAAFDKDSRRFEMMSHGAYISQGYWERLRREEPDRFKRLLSQRRAGDPYHPDDLFFEIGKCSPF